MPKVSAIVIAKNTSCYLPKCLDSLVHQTLKDIEIIVVDDNSDDRTAFVASGYAAEDARVLLYSLDSTHGPGGARNYGVEKARGEYIAFVDSDDWVDLSYLEAASNVMDSTGAEIANTNQVVEYESSYEKPRVKAWYEHPHELDGPLAIRIMSETTRLEFKILPSSLNKMYSRRFLQGYGARYLERVFYEDQHFAYATFLNASKVVCVPGPAYHYLKRVGSITQCYTHKNADDMAYVYLEIKKLLEENSMYSSLRECYVNSLEHCFNLIVRQIFEYVRDDQERKNCMRYAFDAFKGTLDFDEYFELRSAETIRRHIQPHLDNTSIN